MSSEIELKYPETVTIIDSHTEGEPTRVVTDGWPSPAGATMAERRADLAARFDHLRGAVVREPRGHDAVVGALLTPPVEPGSAAGVIFFNNVGYLGMCGHGLIGVVRTLEYLGRLNPGPVQLDTPAGTVAAELGEGGLVTIRNVPAYCHALDVAVEVPGVGRIVGDIAYGGNWFFITQLPDLPLELNQLDELLRTTRSILAALRAQGITGADGAEIDHVEVTGPPADAGADARNFVLCPGGAYDRSPCGTGTSAKLATLHARGQLDFNAEWRQESITGGRFTGWLTRDGDALTPWIRGRAFVTSEAVLRFDPNDPFRAGFGAS
jgi:proline racemase